VAGAAVAGAAEAVAAEAVAAEVVAAEVVAAEAVAAEAVAAVAVAAEAEAHAYILQVIDIKVTRIRSDMAAIDAIVAVTIISSFIAIIVYKSSLNTKYS